MENDNCGIGCRANGEANQPNVVDSPLPKLEEIKKEDSAGSALTYYEK